MVDYIVYVVDGMAIAEVRDAEGFEGKQHILSPELYEKLRTELEQLFKAE